MSARIVLELWSAETTPQSVYLDVFGWVRDGATGEGKGRWEWLEPDGRGSDDG